MKLEAWQRWLWQVVFHADFEQIQRIDTAFWDLLDQAETRDAALKKLPAQLVVFTVLDLPPKQLEFLHRLGNTSISLFFTITLHKNTGQTVSIPTGKRVMTHG